MSTGTRSSSVTSIQPLTWSVNCSTSSPAARMVAKSTSTPNGRSVALAHPPDLLAQVLRTAVRRGDDAEPAGLGHGGGERRARDPAHARLADGIADPEEVAERRVQGALRVAWPRSCSPLPGIERTAGRGVPRRPLSHAPAARGKRATPRVISRVTGRVWRPNVGCQLECFPAPPTTMMLIALGRLDDRHHAWRDRPPRGTAHLLPPVFVPEPRRAGSARARRGTP